MSLNREDLIKAVNADVIRHLDPTKAIPSTGELNDSKRLLKLFDRFIDKLKLKTPLPTEMCFLFANQNGQVAKINSPGEIPQFLQKENSEYFDMSIEEIGANAIGLTAKYQIPISVCKEEHFLKLFQDYTTTSVPIFDEANNMIGILGIISPVETAETSVQYLQELSIGFEIILAEYHKNEVLSTFTKKLYSTVNVNEVLTESIKNINMVYPEDNLEIWLTQDYLISDLPIKQMSYFPSGNDIKDKAFLEGHLIVNRRKNSNNKYELAVPLKGKQGVYGVIYLECTKPCNSSDEKTGFISNMADTIGKAFENAKLYQHSISLVKELQVINDLIKRLNRSLNKESILDFVVKELEDLFHSNYVCMVQVDEDKEEFTVIASNNKENEGKTLPLDYGYMGKVYRKKEPVIVADTLADDYKDTYANNLGGRSLISVPIFVHDQVNGILSVSSKNPNHFSYDNLRMLQLFAQHLGLALTNSFLHEKIQRLAITDYLTTLYNRSFLDEKIGESMQTDETGSILLFDIDDFKKINDIYGHQVGDQILIKVADIIKGSIRKGDIAARWGGEELALYLPRVDKELAVKIAERIRHRVAIETDPKVTISCGVATWVNKDSNLNNLVLIRNADKSLYEAKHRGKNQIIAFG